MFFFFFCVLFIVVLVLVVCSLFSVFRIPHTSCVLFLVLHAVIGGV